MDVEGAGEAHYAKGVCVLVSVTSPDSRKFRIERGEVVFQANSREEGIKVRRIGCATRPHPFRDRAGSGTIRTRIGHGASLIRRYDGKGPPAPAGGPCHALVS